MSALAVERFALEPPVCLPVSRLSLSSIQQFLRCPEQWRRQRIEHEPQPPSGKMILGSAAGAALAQHYGRQIDTGQGLATDDVLDEFATEFDDRVHNEEEIDWGKDQPGPLKDSGAAALRFYHRAIAPGVTPVSVEREFELSWPGLDWCLTGFVDLEDAAGHVRDYKLTGKRLGQPQADMELEPTIYLAARRAEGNPAAGFKYDVMLRTSKPAAYVLETSRTDAQLDRLTEFVFGVAREIAWRWESGNWERGAAPGTWFCGSCRYANCPLRNGGGER